MDRDMPNVNITELRRHLAAYLERAAAGEHLSVTSRGQVIAEITPPTLTEDYAGHARARLAGSVLRFDDPLAPMQPDAEWKMHR
jgi:prevent-host-death family protein